MLFQCLVDQLSSVWDKKFWSCIYMDQDVATNLCFHSSYVHWQDLNSVDGGADRPNVSLIKAFYSNFGF